MNRVILLGRPTKDLEVRQAGDMPVARFTLAVDRIAKKDEADFISCVAFGKPAETIGKYCGKGRRVLVEGRIQTGSYTNKDGGKVYTTDVVVERQTIIDWAEQEAPKKAAPKQMEMEDFMVIPDDLEEDGIPFA